MKSTKKNKLKTLFGDNKNVFIYGLTGSGKDTFLNRLHDKKFDYVYARLADTLKQIITEARLESFDELEVSKRGDKYIRIMHNNVDETLRQFYVHPDPLTPENIGYNRAKMIMERKAFDFTNPHILDDNYIHKLQTYPLLISDVREEKIIKMLLEAGWYGIFIDRIFNHDEYSNPNQITEFNVFGTDTKSTQYRNELFDKYEQQIVVIHDGKSDLFLTGKPKQLRYFNGNYSIESITDYGTIFNNFDDEEVYDLIKSELYRIIKNIRKTNK